MAISFFFENTRVTLTERRRLKDYIERLFKSHGKALESLTYVFCTDKSLLSVNKKFLKHDYFTDIITFDLSESKQRVVAEIYISVDRVKENAKTLAVSIKEELHRVMFHGVLHLCGYRDKSVNEKKNMRLEEDKNLQAYLQSCSTGKMFQGGTFHGKHKY